MVRVSPSPSALGKMAGPPTLRARATPKNCASRPGLV